MRRTTNVSSRMAVNWEAVDVKLIIREMACRNTKALLTGASSSRLLTARAASSTEGTNIGVPSAFIYFW